MRDSYRRMPNRSNRNLLEFVNQVSSRGSAILSLPAGEAAQSHEGHSHRLLPTIPNGAIFLPLEDEAYSAILFRVMLREAPVEPRHEPRQDILRAAARLFQQQGYDATSMNDVAAALKLSKGGLYHHFQSKDEILFHIMSHAMEITEERVINVVRRIDSSTLAGVEERLRTLIRLHIQIVLSPEDREITVMLHENHPLPPTLRRKINGRKKDYVHFVENLVTDIQRKRNSPASVTPRAAAFALLGMINWIYQWYKPDGDLNGDALVAQYTDIFFRGALA
jgi:TetR/AcrR family transcriptional regulator, cholesterol catabolism regulator